MEAHFGIGHGTLTNHAEAGEELFEVFLDRATDDVLYHIRATSWPRAMLARIGHPLARVLQARFRRHSAEAMTTRRAREWHPAMSIYVEILIRAPIDALWAHTQTPALHERWDLRFSRIDYLPKPHETEPQRFRYTTRIGFGFEVSGEGETVGQRDLADGSRSSALKFGSGEALSIIREGSGYWKYIPTADGIRFLTWYDYRTRFGAAGAQFDRLIFRPLIGWATAWSFDRLRLWLEAGRGSRTRDATGAGSLRRSRGAHRDLRVGRCCLQRRCSSRGSTRPINVPSAARCLRRPPEKT